jgi:membrane protein YdbS with pleckstrin-like domain
VTTAADDLPLDGTTHHLDPRMRTVWAVARSLPVVVVAVAAAVVVASAVGAAALAVVAALGLVGLAAAVVTAGWSWRCWTWAAWDDALELRHGVVVRAASLVPYHRIQQIDVHRGPLERALSLSTLVLRTAAATTDARLPGIAAEHAETLRHELLSRAGVDDAV